MLRLIIDFLIIIRILSKKRAYLFVGGQTTPFSEMKLTKDLAALHNKIIECKFENLQWKFMRVRTDKSYPNAYSTAVGKLKQIFTSTPNRIYDFNF